MPKTYNSVWIHLVFGTKNRAPYLNWHIRSEVCNWLRLNAPLHGVHVDVVNGYEDHLHVLFKLGTTQSVSEVAKWIKGASSKWLNEKYSWENGFKWQQGYGVFSVSDQDLKKVRDYIYNQEIIHKSRNYKQEMEQWNHL